MSRSKNLVMLVAIAVTWIATGYGFVVLSRVPEETPSVVVSDGRTTTVWTQVPDPPTTSILRPSTTLSVDSVVSRPADLPTTTAATITTTTTATIATTKPEVTTTVSTQTSSTVPTYNDCDEIVLIHGGGFMIGDPSSMQTYVDNISPEDQYINITYPMVKEWGEGESWYPQQDIYTIPAGKKVAYENALASVLAQIEEFRANGLDCKLTILGVSAGATLAIGVGIRIPSTVIAVNGSALFEDINMNARSEFILIRALEDSVILPETFDQTCMYVKRCSIIDMPGGHGDLRSWHQGNLILKEKTQ